ncbi:hypothetical protein [Rhodococcus opacus]|uniref:Uncharacterized protein n=1 Tax=Rhodococcus opacus (strain B4) TaxID=632772 RepID=C1B9B6_RHOOB|nr:hypothetical protein [Rhodococcus opacus]BAH52269.1 hypothetical protein ROP_40220 [Rhodococcus opacus B4]
MKTLTVVKIGNTVPAEGPFQISLNPGHITAIVEGIPHNGDPCTVIWLTGQSIAITVVGEFADIDQDWMDAL